MTTKPNSPATSETPPNSPELECNECVLIGKSACSHHGIIIDESHWEQKFDPPNQKRDCIHGSLARSCVICGLEHELFDANKEKAQWVKRAERSELTADFTKLNKLQSDLAELRGIAEKMAMHLSAGIRTHGDPCPNDKCTFKEKAREALASWKAFRDKK